jgi:hypothetical protein
MASKYGLHFLLTIKIKQMKKALSNYKALTKGDMKKVIGGRLICGCLDVFDNFYPGPSGASYCWTMYQGEPWCIRR